MNLNLINNIQEKNLIIGINKLLNDLNLKVSQLQVIVYTNKDLIKVFSRSNFNESPDYDSLMIQTDNRIKILNDNLETIKNNLKDYADKINNDMEIILSNQKKIIILMKIVETIYSYQF